MKRVTIFGALALLGYPGCSGAQRAAGEQALACVESAAVKDLEPTVAGILTTGGTGWEAALEGLGVSFGVDAVTCAVQYVEQLWSLRSGSGSAETASLGMDQKIIRARQWLTEHSK